MKIIDHASQGLVQYNFANDALRIIRTNGVTLKSQIGMQKQCVVRHYVDVALACDGSGGIPRNFIRTRKSDDVITIVTLDVGCYAPQVQWIP